MLLRVRMGCKSKMNKEKHKIYCLLKYQELQRLTEC